MYTRQDYLRNHCSFADYYGQFVTDYIRNIVAKRFGLAELKRAYVINEYLNSIPLCEWDKLQPITKQLDTINALKAAGDFWTPAVHVCIVKQAAKQLIKNPDLLNQTTNTSKE